MFVKRLVLIAFFTLAPMVLMASSEATHPVSPEQGLQMLVDGNLRFSLGQAARPNSDFSRRLLTATKGQAPFATIIACSDSRVPVEILFDQGVGDLFVIKVAGNVADIDEIGSAEYGVDHLGTPVLMVLGHTYCGAVTAVTTGAEVHGAIPQLVDNIIPALEKAKHEHPQAEGADLIAKVTDANLWQAVEDLLTKSHAISARAAAGKVAVVGAMYDILSGKVTILGTHPRQAELLAGASHAAPAGHGAHPAPAAAAGHAEPAKAAAHAEPAKAAAHAEPAKAAQAPKHAEPAAAHGEQKAAPAKAVHEAPAAEKKGDHAQAAQAEEKSGGFGFMSFIIFVLLLIGAVIVLDEKVLNPKK